MASLLAVCILCAAGSSANEQDPSVRFLSALKTVEEGREQATRGQIPKAISLYESALSVMASLAGNRHWTVAIVENDLAKAHLQARSLEAAKLHTLRALSIVDDGTVKQADHAQFLLTATKVAIAQADWPAAQRYLDNASVLDVVRLQPDLGLQLAFTTATFHFHRNEFTDAVRMFDDALGYLDMSTQQNALMKCRILLDTLKARLRLSQVDRVKAELGTLKQRPFFAICSQDQSLKIGTEFLNAELAFFEMRIADHDAALAKLKSLVDQIPESEEAVKFLNQSASTAMFSGDYVNAERKFLAALEAAELIFSDRATNLGTIFHNLGLVYQELGDLELSDRFYGRAIEVFSSVDDGQNDALAGTLAERSRLRRLQGRLDDAEQDSSTSLAISQQVSSGVSDHRFALRWNGHGRALYEQGRTEESIESFEKSVDYFSKVEGDVSIDEIPVLTNLAEAKTDIGDLEAAERHADRARELTAALNRRFPTAFHNISAVRAKLLAAQGQWDEASSEMHRNLVLHERRLKQVSRRPTYSNEFATNLVRDDVERYLEIAAASVASGGPPINLDDLFFAFQLPLFSTASEAVRQVAVGAQVQSAELKSALQERGSISRDIRTLSKSFSHNVRNFGVAYTTEATTRFTERLNVLESRLEAIDRMIEVTYPEFAAYFSPRIRTVQETQDQISPEQGVVSTFLGKEGLYVLLITKETVLFNRSQCDPILVTSLVENIRATLRIEKTFDAKSSHGLQQCVFSGIQDALEAVDEILYVADAQLQGIPPSILVSRIDTDAVRKNTFMLERWLMTTVPAVDILFVGRQTSASAKESMRSIGFGNPYYKTRDDQDGKRGTVAGSANREPGVYYLDGVNIPELPFTEEELIHIENLLGLENTTTLLGREASETTVKETDYGAFDVVYFATHGVLAYEVPEIQEPALLLSRPDFPTREDDGVLLASEIAALSMDVDLVVLSACNTAGSSGRPGAPGFSGLVRSFFHSGAKTVLASNWYISDVGTAILLPRIISRRLEAPEKSINEALRQAMLDLLNSEEEDLRHPAIWGPFVAIGT
ncbi:CHAT domain-containing protein [Roseibium album]|uniref:CHAT domain-containing protein n=1 Tax=Roseibium album TaxID=311410 RepID=UPI003BB0F659